MNRLAHRARYGSVVALLAAAACAPDPPSSVIGLKVAGCDTGIEIGSGMVVDAGLVLTSAHVVAGARSIMVTRDGRDDVAATVVAFDPKIDLAYLAIPADNTVTLDISSGHVDTGDTGVAYVVRDGQPTTLPVRVIRPVTINTEDIYIQGETNRPGFELAVDIVRGDSGGAVVIDGKVIGVLWARSRNREARAYAIDAEQGAALITEQLASGDLGDVDLARCS